jgi:HSP20 family protein
MLPLVPKSDPLKSHASKNIPQDAPIGDMFNRMLGCFSSWTEEMVGDYPVDMREEAGHLLVEAELPGFKPSQINITLDRGHLRIKARRRRNESRSKIHLRERRFTEVDRTFSLPVAVQENKVRAYIDEGILYLRIAKRSNRSLDG